MNTTKFQVELLAFGRFGEIREVEVPESDLARVQVGSAAGRIWASLSLIFYFGQNEFQSQSHPSVSVGDVIHFEDRRFLVRPVGFRELTDIEYREYMALDRRDRSYSSLVREEVET